MFPKKLHRKIEQRLLDGSLRSLGKSLLGKVDFSSNDYLGYAKDEELYEQSHHWIEGFTIKNGATGSRLLSGNFDFHQEVETSIARFHQVESALLYNSGYVANIGFFSSVPQRGDLVFYDELIHASIRDALAMSFAKSIKFKHNDLADLERLLNKYKDTPNADFYIATESVFSMDGDSPNLIKMANLADDFKAYLVVDEAHSLGVFGERGEGLVQMLNLQDKVFARIMTYGKALGGHGATIVGSQELKEYLINFSRSFIYTTALAPHSVAQIKGGYEYLENQINTEELKNIIDYFNQKINQFSKKEFFISSRSAIHSISISGNEKVKNVARQLSDGGFDVKPILSPTVPKGEERLRITLHAYNTQKEIEDFFSLLNQILL